MNHIERIKAIAIEMAISPIVKAFILADPNGVVSKQIQQILDTTDDLMDTKKNDVFKIINKAAGEEIRNELIANAFVIKVTSEMLKQLDAKKAGGSLN